MVARLSFWSCGVVESPAHGQGTSSSRRDRDPVRGSERGRDEDEQDNQHRMARKYSNHEVLLPSTSPTHGADGQLYLNIVHSMHPGSHSRVHSKAHPGVSLPEKRE